MTITEMLGAVRAAKSELEAADTVAENLARLLIGRTRNVNSHWVLAELKKELKSFNAHTGRWSK